MITKRTKECPHCLAKWVFEDAIEGLRASPSIRFETDKELLQLKKEFQSLVSDPSEPFTRCKFLTVKIDSASYEMLQCPECLNYWNLKTGEEHMEEYLYSDLFSEHDLSVSNISKESHRGTNNDTLE